MAQFPSAEIARLSFDYRTLGLGFANLGGFLMSSGIAYDSDEGRAICGALSALMTGICYATSAEMAAERGPFPGHAPNAAAMLRVMRNHRRAANGEAAGYEALSVAPVPLDRAASRIPPWWIMPRAVPGISRSRSANSTATAMPRSRSWRRRARSAS